MSNIRIFHEKADNKRPQSNDADPIADFLDQQFIAFTS